MSFDVRDYILLIDDIVPQSLCDALLNEYVPTDEWVSTSTKGGLRPDIRSAQTILISTDPVINFNHAVRRNLDSELFNCASTAIREYNRRFDLCHIEQDSGYELLRYRLGEFYTQHTDSFRESPRAVSCSFALNDDYEGGNFEFFDGQMAFKLPKGSVLMFPSNFMYPHEIKPVMSGTRYSIITWFV
jgi:hypothetical protein